MAKAANLALVETQDYLALPIADTAAAGRVLGPYFRTDRFWWKDAGGTEHDIGEHLLPLTGARAMTGPLEAAPGTAALPSIHFGDATTGLRGGAGLISVSTGGANRWFWSGAGHLRPWLDGTYEIGADTLALRHIYSDRVHIDSAATVAAPALTPKGALASGLHYDNVTPSFVWGIAGMEKQRIGIATPMHLTQAVTGLVPIINLENTTHGQTVGLMINAAGDLLFQVGARIVTLPMAVSGTISVL